MKRRYRTLAQAILVVVAAAVAQAEEAAPAPSWTFGLRAGPSILTQDLIKDADGIETAVGPMVNLQGFYALTPNLALGLMVEWERHDIDVFPIELGNTETLSILPAVEFRPGRFDQLMPYASLGLGVNLNRVNESAIVRFEGVSIDPDHTFAAKLAVGCDFFLTDHLALNAEIGWKYNRGNAVVTIRDPFFFSQFRERFNASTFVALLGLRFHL